MTGTLRIVATFVIAVQFAASVFAQEEEPLASLPGQYKRVHQEAYKKILSGKTNQAIASLEEFLKEHPKDRETFYMLAVAHAHSGSLDKAVEQAKRAVESGLPPGRIVVATRTGLADVLKTDYGKGLLQQFQHKLIHGPMTGDVTPAGFSVWVRTADEADLQLEVSTSGDFKDVVESKIVRSKADDDFTAVVSIAELQPATTYHYKMRVNGKVEDQPEEGYTVQTHPVQGEPTKFRLAFGGGAGYVPPNERMWNTIGDEKPDMLVLLGDNVYIDDPQTPAMQHYTYHRRQSRPEYRRLIAQTPVYCIWDDHDFGTNDCSGGPEIDKPKWKRPVWNVFKNNWVNPGYGGGEKQPGCWYDFNRGDVHFIMLDGRYYRNLRPEDKDAEGKGRSSMLGPVQRKWLLDTLRNSKGKLIVLCSPVPWVLEAKGDSKDTWNGFQEERGEIFDFLAENKIEGVILMSADRHRSDLWKIERENGYPLYEFNSSRLTNQHVHPTMKEAVFSYNRKQSFGTVDIDTTLDDPTITYRVVNIDGKEVHKHTVKSSELVHK